MDSEWASEDCREPLQYTVRPSMFWNRCKLDFVQYMNASVEIATKETVAESLKDEDGIIIMRQMQQTRPILPFIDKPGVFDTWLSEVKQWASTSGFAVELSADIQDSGSSLCEAFRELENMPKPYRFVAIA